MAFCRTRCRLCFDVLIREMHLVIPWDFNSRPLIGWFPRPARATCKIAKSNMQISASFLLKWQAGNSKLYLSLASQSWSFLLRQFKIAQLFVGRCTIVIWGWKSSESTTGWRLACSACIICLSAYRVHLSTPFWLQKRRSREKGKRAQRRTSNALLD